jgi:hypothetical protein
VKAALFATLALALALATTGCHQSDGLVVVDVSTTVDITRPIDHLGAELTSPYGDTTHEVGMSPVTLPTSFGMLVAKRFDAAITVTVTAYDVNDNIIASGVGMGSAHKGERSTVKVVLDHGPPPPADMTIVDTGDLGGTDMNDDGGP